MKSAALFLTFLTAAAAAALPDPAGNERSTSSIRPLCVCEGPICIISPKGACECKNQHAYACYNYFVSRGVPCIPPKIQDCSGLAN